MSASDPRELIGAYVLGACTPEEAAEVRAQMVASPAFRAEVESFDPVREALLDVPAPDVRPGADLKRRLMAQVQEEASLFAAAGTATDDRDVAAPAAGTATLADPREPADRHEPTPDGEDGPDHAAGRAPIGASSGARATDATAANATPPDVTAANAAPADATPTGGAPAPAGPARGSTPAGPGRTGFLAALRHPARATALVAVIVALVVAGVVVGGGGSDEQRVQGSVLTQTSGGASVELVSTGDQHRLQVRGLPAPTSGKEYQVWLQHGQDAPKPTKVLFSVDADGRAQASIDDSLDGVDHVLVTAEPRGGSPAPTSAPVLRVDV